MSITANSKVSNSSKNQEAITSNTNGSLANLGAELVYTQDRTGRYLSFCWQNSEKLGLKTKQTISDLDEAPSLAPVDKAAYLEKLQQILTSLVPERFQCWFCYRQELYELELVMTPILPTVGSVATTVLVMGRLLGATTANEKAKAVPLRTQAKLALRSQQHHSSINQITRNISRTLDLEIIWQQTVDSLGQALGIDRCIICPYEPLSTKVQVIAEYHLPNVGSMLGAEIDIASFPAFAQALETQEPMFVENCQHDQFYGQNILVVATSHKEQANSLIAVTLDENCTGVTVDELELALDVGEQLGTAIAHATLYQELGAASQQAEDATRHIREFLANVTHELRTPLNGIIGFLKLILEGMADDPEEQEQFLNEAYKSSIYLLDIINDILDIARIESGKMELELSSVRLDELFNDVENFMRLQAEQKCLSFHMHMPDTCDEIMLQGDYQRLKQVMLNLLSNAIKFTHEGGITVSADLVRKKLAFNDQQFPGMVRVRVADTGIGVSLDKQDKLFQLFSQVDGSRTRQYGGTGLGLAISQKLVEAMGGEVNFYSLGEGLGSTVTFTVPLYQQPVMVSPTETNSPEQS